MLRVCVCVERERDAEELEFVQFVVPWIDLETVTLWCWMEGGMCLDRPTAPVLLSAVAVTIDFSLKG